jgi:hypothetical protein
MLAELGYKMLPAENAFAAPKIVRRDAGTLRTLSLLHFAANPIRGIGAVVSWRQPTFVRSFDEQTCSCCARASVRNKI